MCILVRMKSFPRFWRNHSYCRNKWYLIWTGCLFSLRWSKKIKMADSKKNSFSSSACFRAYVRQPHDHISWATPMRFTSINSTNPRTNPWNFHEKILRIGGAGKWGFFWVGHFDFFCFISMKTSSPFIWGIIYFCNMDVFLRILENTWSELIYTRL